MTSATVPTGARVGEFRDHLGMARLGDAPAAEAMPAEAGQEGEKLRTLQQVVAGWISGLWA